MRKLAMIFVLLFSAPVMACDWAEGWQVMQTEGNTDFQVAIFAEDEPAPISQPFDIFVRLCGENAEITKFDVSAMMPAHQHGMNYEPAVERLGALDFQISNMLFHMPGDWRIDVSVFAEDRPVHFELGMKAK